MAWHSQDPHQERMLNEEWRKKVCPIHRHGGPRLLPLSQLLTPKRYRQIPIACSVSVSLNNKEANGECFRYPWFEPECVAGTWFELGLLVKDISDSLSRPHWHSGYNGTYDVHDTLSLPSLWEMQKSSLFPMRRHFNAGLGLPCIEICFRAL
jgi:hypothetical protein